MNETPARRLVFDIGFAQTTVTAPGTFDEIRPAAHNVQFRQREGGRGIVFMALLPHGSYSVNLAMELLPKSLELPSGWSKDCGDLISEFEDRPAAWLRELGRRPSLDADNICAASEGMFRREVILERVRQRWAGVRELQLVHGQGLEGLVWRSDSGRTTCRVVIALENSENSFDFMVGGWPTIEESEAAAHELVTNFRVTDPEEEKRLRKKSRPLADGARVYPADEPTK